MEYLQETVLAFFWLVYLFESYLSRRQRKIYETSKEVPKELSSVIDNETFEKARKYALDKSVFGFWNGLYSQIEGSVILQFGGYAYLWMLSGDVIAYCFGLDSSYEIAQSCMFATLGQLFGIVTEMPWSLYSTFVLEERHGFNKMTLGFYFKDLVKKTILSQVLSLPIISIIVYIIQAGGEYFYIYAWATVFLISMILLHVYPEFIAPLFDKYETLPDGELREKIEELAASLDYPLKKLYVVDGSKRSAHSNAYMYGFYKNKRIVLFDTLLEDYTPVGRTEEAAESKGDSTTEGGNQDSSVDKKDRKIGCNTEEVVAVLGHELGHWKFSHMLKNLAIVQVKIFISFFFFGKLMNNHSIFTSFGFVDQQPILIRLIIVFSFIFSPFNEVEEFLMHILSRKFEFQADEFAIELGKRENLKTALLKLHKDNLSFPIADWMYSARHFSHPPILERLRAMDQYKIKAE